MSARGTGTPESVHRVCKGGKGHAGRSGKGKAVRRPKHGKKTGTVRIAPKPVKQVRKLNAAAATTKRRALVKRPRLVKHARLVRRASLKARTVVPRRPLRQRGRTERAGTFVAMQAALFWRAASRRVTAQRSQAAVLGEFRSAQRQLKRVQRFARLNEVIIRRAEAEATRRVPRPTRPLHSSRAALWRWYQSNGWSWARFVADHGPG